MMLRMWEEVLLVDFSSHGRVKVVIQEAPVNDSLGQKIGLVNNIAWLAQLVERRSHKLMTSTQW
jgi:hypothetical protein